MARYSVKNVVLALAATLTSFASAATVTYDFNVTWVNRNPDGLHERRVQGINGQWPIPTINVDVGDRLVVNLYNGLGNEAASLHFHGLYQNGTTDMDGVGSVSQCAIPPGSSFTYNFTIDQPGTYWYHSHIDGQYPDGLRGPLIVHDPENPYQDLIDEELVLTLSDWYHDEMPVLTRQFLTVTNPTGAEPVPKSALMNDTQNATISVEPGKTYFIRIINMAAFAGQHFWIEGHTFKIMEVDGVYHEPAEASMIYISAAQRYGILLTTKNQTSENFAMVGAMDEDLFDSVPDDLNPNVTSYLVYNSAAVLPKPALLDAYDDFDDMTLVPTDGMLLLEDPVTTIQVAVAMDNLGNGYNYAFFNDITYVPPKVPTLYTVMTAGELATNAAVYGEDTHSFVLGHNQVIEMVVNNHDTGKHPFHLHGHAFQSLVRSDENVGDWDPVEVTNGSVTIPSKPMRRDTLLLRPQGHFVIRYRSDNPGVWLFHCHIEWHVLSGLILTIVEAPLEVQKNLTIPADHYAACAANSPPMATAGNAAGNTQNLLDLKGQNSAPAPLPAGFTPGGIVALVFSCIAGILGLGVISWYGLGEMGMIEQQKEQNKIDHMVQVTGVDSHVSDVMSETRVPHATNDAGIAR